MSDHDYFLHVGTVSSPRRLKNYQNEQEKEKKLTEYQVQLWNTSN